MDNFIWRHAVPRYAENLFRARALRTIAEHDPNAACPTIDDAGNVGSATASVSRNGDARGRQRGEGHPLFLFYSFHLLHTPMQVPFRYLEEVDALVKAAGGAPIDSQNRRLYVTAVCSLMQ